MTPSAWRTRSVVDGAKSTIAVVVLIFAMGRATAQEEDATVSLSSFSLLDFLEGSWLVYPVPHRLLASPIAHIDLSASTTNDNVLLGFFTLTDDSALSILGALRPAAASDMPTGSGDVAASLRAFHLAVKGLSTLSAEIEATATTPELATIGDAASERNISTHAELTAALTAEDSTAEHPAGAAPSYLVDVTLTGTGTAAVLFVGRSIVAGRPFVWRRGDAVLTSTTHWQVAWTVYGLQSFAISAVATTVTTRSTPQQGTAGQWSNTTTFKWIASRANLEETWAGKWKQMVGAAVMLVVTFGGRFGGRWYLRRRGINPEGFLKGFWRGAKKSKGGQVLTAEQEAAQMLGMNLPPGGKSLPPGAARATAGRGGPITPAQRASLAAKHGMYLRMMDEADAAEGRKKNTS